MTVEPGPLDGGRKKMDGKNVASWLLFRSWWYELQTFPLVSVVGGERGPEEKAKDIWMNFLGPGAQRSNRSATLMWSQISRKQIWQTSSGGDLWATWVLFWIRGNEASIISQPNTCFQGERDSGIELGRWRGWPSWKAPSCPNCQHSLVHVLVEVGGMLVLATWRTGLISCSCFKMFSKHFHQVIHLYSTKF